MTIVMMASIPIEIEVEIEKAFSHSLWGKYLEHEPTPLRLKGEGSYAA